MEINNKYIIKEAFQNFSSVRLQSDIYALWPQL